MADNNPVGDRTQPDDSSLIEPLTGEYKHWDQLLQNVNKTLNSLEVILFSNEVSKLQIILSLSLSLSLSSPDWQLSINFVA